MTKNCTGSFDMANSLREAALVALDALREIEWSNNSQWQGDRAREAKNVLSAALQQPEQEPVNNNG